MRTLMSTRNLKLAAVVLVAAVSVSVLMLIGGYADRAQAQTPGGDAALLENMDPLLEEIALQYAMGTLSAKSAAAQAPVHSEESVGVIFLTEPGASEDVRDYLLENGASPGPAFDGHLGADVPVSLLAEASQQEGVTWMHASVRPRVAEDDPVDTGAVAHGVDVWHAGGLKGEGVKIAVLGLGFPGLQEALGTELPETVITRCYTGYGLYSDDISDCETETGLSTVRAVRVHDIAPEATYYIVTIDDWVDLNDAVKWLVEEQVDVVYSPILFLYTGPGDGTSPYALSDLNSVDDAIEGGITWVVPAGNDAQTTWFGAFRDQDGDGFHEFDGEDECNRVALEHGEPYMGLMRWEDKWVGPFNPLELRDLDIQMVHEETGIPIRRSYRSFLARTAPLEYFYFRPRLEGNYCLMVQLNVGTAPDWVQVQSFRGGDLEHPSLFGSIASPAESNNPGLISVGTTTPGNLDEIWEESSRGPGPEPWPEGRIKPEIVGANSDVAHESVTMTGTGWAAAGMAGVAALVKQRFPEFDPEDVANYLKEHAEDRGEPGPDNTWGYGFAMLPSGDVATPEDEQCFVRIDGDIDRTGTWDEGCVSSHATRHGIEEGRYARFYTFTVDAYTDVTIDLSSNDQDVYLYLMEGNRKNGEIIEENDDDFTGEGYNSRIAVSSLAPGDYTIEATTYYVEKKGEFRIVVDMETSAVQPEPPAEPTLTGPFSAFSRGTDHVCAVLESDGSIACWSADGSDEVSPPSGEYSAISSGDGGSCALRNDGAAVCWGSLEVDPESDETAMGPFMSVSRGSDHACALNSEGAITCWGPEEDVQAPSGEYSAISSGDGGSCALRNDDALVCWGSFGLSP